jgi:hypothetical protein
MTVEYIFSVEICTSRSDQMSECTQMNKKTAHHFETVYKIEG